MNLSQSNGISLAWDYTICYLPPDTGENTPP